jgi:deoxycytidine triphosphate deaminase
MWTPYSGNETGIEKTTVCEACRVCTHRHCSVLKSRTCKIHKHMIRFWEREHAHKMLIVVFQDYIDMGDTVVAWFVGRSVQ